MKEQSTTKGFAVLSAASIMVKLLSLLYVPFLTAIITQEGYGVYNSSYTIFVFVYVITNSGIPIAISKFVSELIAQENYRDAVKAFKIARAMLLILGLIMSLLMILLAAPMARITHSSRAYLSLVALSPTILITSVVSAYRGYFQGRGNMTPTAVSQVGEQVFNTIFSLIFAALLIRKSIEAGVAGATIGTTLGALFACIYLILKYEKNKRFKIPKQNSIERVQRLSNKSIARRLISYGMPITLSVGLQNAGNLVDVGNIKGRLISAGFNKHITDAKFGTLGQFNTLINVPITLISSLCASVLPSISGAVAVNDKKRLQDKIGYALKLSFMISIPAAVGLTVLGGPVFSVLFGKSAEEGELLLRYGSVVVVLMSVVQIQTTILQGVGKLYIVTISMMLGIICKITANYLLVAIPSINILGAVYGNIICFTIPLLINRWHINKTLKIKVKMSKHIIRPLIASIFMGLFVYITYFIFENFIIYEGARRFIQIIPIIISVVIGVVVYVYSLILIGGITSKDISALSPRMTRIIPNFMKERIR